MSKLTLNTRRQLAQSLSRWYGAISGRTDGPLLHPELHKIEEAILNERAFRPQTPSSEDLALALSETLDSESAELLK